jgi:uncharacterized membrane protein
MSGNSISRPDSSTFSAALVGILFITYPFIVYLALDHFQPRIIGAGLIAIFILRLLLVRRSLKDSFLQQILPLLMAVIILLLAVLNNSSSTLRFTPVVMNISLLLIFSFSLIFPPSMIERFARLAYGAEMPVYVIAYTRKVTWLWCAFFLFNSLMSAYTAVYASLRFWTLYNGMLAYLLVGILFAGEYLVRLRVRHLHESCSQDSHEQGAKR